MRTTPLSRTHLFGRIAAAALGGYAFCGGFIALGLALLYGAGLSFHDAEHLASIVGLLLFLGVFCWAFAARSLPKVWVILAGGSVLMSGGAALVQRALLAAAGGL
jgi:hypothetical protein